MAVMKITLDDLRQMIDREGLILQGCGGDPQGWLDALNELLTEDCVLKNGEAFTNVSPFELDGDTNLLFDMEGVDLNVSRLAMSRIASHGAFGGVWLSDFRVNQLGMPEQTSGEIPEKTQRPNAPIIGADGNIFNIVGIASRTLKRAGQNEAAQEMLERVQSSDSYTAALTIITDYVEPVSAEPELEM